MRNGMPSLHPNPAGDIPQVDAAAYVDPMAQVLGRVLVDAGTFVGLTAGYKQSDLERKR